MEIRQADSGGVGELRHRASSFGEVPDKQDHAHVFSVYAHTKHTQNPTSRVLGRAKVT